MNFCLVLFDQELFSSLYHCPSKNFMYGSCSLVDGLHDAFFEHNSNHALHNMTMLNAGLTMYIFSILDEMSHSITLESHKTKKIEEFSGQVHKIGRFFMKIFR